MIGVPQQQSDRQRKALPVQVSHNFMPDSAVFDDDNLVSCAGLVPVMTLAEQTGLAELLAEKVRIVESKIKSGAANPAPKLATLIAGMCAGADSIDDVDVVRSGGMKTLFGGVYAPSTIGTLLREFSFGHARQLESVLGAHLGALCGRVDLLPGADVRAFIDIDSLLRPVYGHAKQGASYGHTKIAGKQVLRKGLSPLAATISTDTAAPVIAGMRLRAGRTGSGKGAGRMVAQAIATARAAGVSGSLLVRGDAAYGTRAVVGACRRAGAQFSLVLTKNTAVQKAIDAIEDGRVDTGGLSGCGARPRHRRLDLRCRGRRNLLHRLRFHHRRGDRPADRAPRQRRPLPRRAVPGVALSPVLHQLHRTGRRRRHHPPPPRDHRDRVRRPDRRAAGAHAVGAFWRQLGLGPVRRDRPQPAARRRQDSPVVSTPPRAGPLCAARSSTFPPAWPARNANPSCTCPATGPGQTHGLRCGATQSAISTDNPPDPTIPPDTARPGTNKGKAGQTSRPNVPAHPTIKINAQLIGPRTPSVDLGLDADTDPFADA